MSNQTADVIAYNGKIATQNEQRSMVMLSIVSSTIWWPHLGQRM